MCQKLCAVGPAVPAVSLRSPTMTTVAAPTDVDLLMPIPATAGALVGYARVSTRDQHLDRQLAALDDAGCFRVFADKLSGRNVDRPELSACLDYLRPGDILVVTSLDRLGRSLDDLITIAPLRFFDQTGQERTRRHTAPPILDRTAPTSAPSCTRRRPTPATADPPPDEHPQEQPHPSQHGKHPPAATPENTAPDNPEPEKSAPVAATTSAAFLATLLDRGSFRSWDSPPHRPASNDPGGYRRELASARERAGTDEAVVTGQGTIHGHAVAVICSEFGFLAGSIGTASARRLLEAIDRATEQRLPLIAAPASGGTRMQEGTAAFLCMPAIAAAITRHKAAGLPYLVYLRHPTTGGVLASWASLGHITLAEPGALIGFLGAKVYRALRGESFPRDVQTAENLLHHGIVDEVVPPAKLARVIADVLTVCTARPRPRTSRPPQAHRTSPPRPPGKPSPPPAGATALELATWSPTTPVAASASAAPAEASRRPGST